MSVRGKTIRKVLIAVTSVLLISGCSPTVHNRGYVTDTVDFSVVKPGVHTKSHVQQLLGSPSTTSTGRHDIWYYISKKTKQRAFLNPRIKHEQIVAVSFDDKEMVSGIWKTEGEHALNIEPHSGHTKTKGYESSLLREVFSNLGRMGSKKPRQEA